MGSALSPVWVSVILIPQSARNTNRVQLFPNRLRGGTSSPVKSLAPSTALPDCSIFSAQRRMSSGEC